MMDAITFIDLISNCEWKANLDEDFYIISGPDLNRVNNVTLNCEFTILIHCKSGHISGIVNNDPFEIVSGDVRFFFPRQFIQFQGCNGCETVSIMMLSVSFLRSLDIDTYLTSIDPDKNYMTNTTSRGAFENYLLICRDIIEGLHNTEKKETIRLLTKAYIVAMSQFLIQENNSVKYNNSEKHDLVKGFFHYLRKEYTKYHRVEHYADILCTTPKNLSAVLKRSTGYGAYYWIERRIIIDAKIRLTDTDYSIARISEMLGFSNQTVFGRFFVNNVGCSPMEFRKQCKSR